MNCSDDEKKGGNPYDPSKPFVCNSFLPDSGGVGTKLIIRGENFGTDTSLVKVTVNGRNARVIGVNDTRIYAVVPSRADTGLVTVTMGLDADARSFTFEKSFYYLFKQNVSTLVGQTKPDGDSQVTDGTLADAWIKLPVWLTIDRDGVLYVLEERLGLRIVNETEDKVTTPMRQSGGIDRVRTIDFSLSQDTLFLTNDTWDHQGVAVATMTRNNGFMNTKLLVSSHTCNAAIINPVDGEMFYNRYEDGIVRRYDWATGTSIDLTRIDESTEMSFCFTHDGKTLYIICRNRNIIYKADYNFATKTLSDVVEFCGGKNSWGFNDGAGTDARFDQPCETVFDEYGYLYVADRNNHCIRMITPEGIVSTFAGVPREAGYVDGEPLKSKFREPEGIAIDANGVLYIADRGNHRIRKILVE